MQELYTGRLGGSGNQQIGVADAALMGATLVGELAVDIDRAPPLLCLDRALWESTHLAPTFVELLAVASALEYLQRNHRTRGDAPAAASSRGMTPANRAGAARAAMRWCQPVAAA